MHQKKIKTNHKTKNKPPQTLILLFQLPQQLPLKADDYMLFLFTSLPVHTKLLEKQLSHVSYYSMQFSQHISLPCPQVFL